MKGIIFDLDGTMIDNMNVHHRAWQRKLAALGLNWDFETVKREVHGVNEEILERLFGKRFNLEERQKIAAEKERQQAAAQINPEDLAVYVRLREQRAGVAVSRVKDRACGACGSTLTAALNQAARSPSQVVFCDLCGRILCGS